MSTPDPVAAALSGVVVVILVDYLRQHQAWGWMRLVQGPGVLRDEPGLQFAKVMGSGHEGGFSLRPSTTHQGLICMFANAAQADAFLTGPHVQQMRERARESWTGILSVTASRGSWDGQVWGTTPASVLGAYASAGQAESGAIAALTRASIRPAKTATFWRMAPAAQSELDHAPGCEIAAGLGEAPLLRQCTFSVWQDTASMLAYSMNGAHRKAVDLAHSKGYFSESMFVRMRVLQHQGQWPRPETSEPTLAHG
jgi:spheroidene monooxygenase